MDTVSYRSELVDESIALKNAWKSCSTAYTEKKKQLRERMFVDIYSHTWTVAVQFPET